MPDFDPTRPPPGRLARLGVIVDVGDPRAGAIARLCDRAGIDIVWFGSPASAGTDEPGGDQVPTDCADVAASFVSARVGWYMDGPGLVPDVANELWSSVSPAASSSPGGPRVRRSATLDDLRRLPALLARVDDVVLTAWGSPDLETAADEVRAEAAEAGRDPSTLGVAVVVPVSIGRTEAEASVRADGDPVFRATGHPQEVGIFGTLEECQDRVIALAHAGITDLRCVLPSALDVHDVIAQLTAITIGTTDVLIPGSLRSPAPPPPDGWGGRPDVPPRPGVSGGSRRR